MINAHNVHIIMWDYPDDKCSQRTTDYYTTWTHSSQSTWKLAEAGY